MTFGSKAGRRRMWRGWDVNCPCCYASARSGVKARSLPGAIMMDDIGGKWLSPDGSVWKVVSKVEDGMVSLSGPGPCRSLIRSRWQPYSATGSNNEMASLYDLTGVYKNLLDSVIDWETGEFNEEKVPNFGALFENVEDGIKVKLDGCARVLRTLKSEAEELKREEERIAKRRKSLERNHDALKEYMLGCMQFADIRNIKTALFTMFLSLPKPSVKVTNLKKLPAKYKVEQDPKPDKKALMVELKAGKKVEGAILEDGKESLVVR